MTSDAESASKDRADDLADYAGDANITNLTFAWSRLVNPPALRGVAALIAGLVFLGTGQSDRSLAVVGGLVLVVWGLAELAALATRRSGWRQLVTPLLIVALGITLIFWPAISVPTMALLVGGALVYFGVRELRQAARESPSSGRRRWLAIKGVFVVVLGAAVLLVPSAMLAFAFLIVALIFIVTGIATIVGNLTGPDEPFEVSDVWPRFFTWLESRPHTADDRRQLYAKIFYEGEDAVRRLSRFFILMAFATAIAAFGVVSDSTAVVIGAMLIAPLMTPLMATSLSLIMGWPKRASMSLGVALLGIFLAVGLAMLVGAILPWELNSQTNSQISSRVAPNLVDLMIAIAAGGAGAFALSRPDVSDALPGVAVAIALVPPLAVVGLMIEAGAGAEALGAALLFTTNMLAILLVGSMVFVLTGVAPLQQLVSEREWIRNAVTLVAILGVAVFAALAVSSEEVRTQAFDRDNVQLAVDAWVEGEDELDVISIDVVGGDVKIVVLGPEEPPSVEALAADLEAELGRNLKVTVRWVPERVFVVDGTAGS